MPSQYKEPANRITKPEQITEGMTIYHVYLHLPEQGVGEFKVLQGVHKHPESDHNDEDPDRWIRLNPINGHFNIDRWSLWDANIGRSYNDNYFFLTKEDAENAIKNRKGIGELTFPTLKELNELSSADNCLLLLRILNTSDLTFMYMLFTDKTACDIIEVCTDMLRLDDEYIKTVWPAVQIAEYQTYLDTLREYVENYTPPNK